MNKQALTNDVVMLGLDISYHRTGWAVTKGFELIGYGHLVPPTQFKKVTFKDADFSDVLHWYMKEILGVCKAANPHFVAMEDLNVRFVNTAKVMMQIQAAAKIGVVSFGASVNMINNKTVKSFWGVETRKKSIPKEIHDLAMKHKQKPVKIQMVDKVNRMFGLDLTYEENDEADAIGLCLTLLKELGENLE
jgi:Holliday junction resolvasome RuvABC endonuclease subunit